MANENKKDFNAMLHDSKDMPKFQIITDKKNLLLLHRFCPAFPVSGTAASRRKSSGRYFFTT